MRVMGLDVGSKTVGVAISDPLGFTAQGVEIITLKDHVLRQAKPMVTKSRKSLEFL